MPALIPSRTSLLAWLWFPSAAALTFSASAVSRSVSATLSLEASAPVGTAIFTDLPSIFCAAPFTLISSILLTCAFSSTVASFFSAVSTLAARAVSSEALAYSPILRAAIASVT